MRSHFAAAAFACILAAAPAAAQLAPVEIAFAAGKADLAPAEHAKLDAAVDSYRRAGQASVILAAHADKTEADAVNLSQRRANAVREYLVAQGVPEAVITTQAFGNERPVVDGASPKNRRVEMTFGPGSGW